MGPSRRNRYWWEIAICFVIDSSSSSDLGSRRGAFSRRHYGSVELVIWIIFFSLILFALLGSSELFPHCFLFVIYLASRPDLQKLPQTETDSNDMIRSRRFRLENGDCIGDRDDVSADLKDITDWDWWIELHGSPGVQLAQHARSGESRIPNSLVLQILSRQA